MKVWVNGVERADIARRALPQDILSAIDDEAGQSGSVLSELYVDGKKMSRENFSALALGEWDTVIFTLMPFMDFLRDALNDAEIYSHKLIEGIETLIHLLERAYERHDDIMGTLSATSSSDVGFIVLFQGLGWLSSVYVQGKNYAPLPLHPENEIMLETEIKDVLTRIVDLQYNLRVIEEDFLRAQENNDSTYDRDSALERAQDICQKFIHCLSKELLPQMQMLDRRVSEVAQALRMPIQ